MVGYSEKREGNFVREDDTKIFGEKEGSGDETTLIKIEVPKQHNIHYTCNLALGKALWVIPSKFFCWRVGKRFCITTRNTDHPIGLLHFAGHLPHVLKHTELGDFLSLLHTLQCIESVAPRTVFCTSLSSTMCKMNQLDSPDYGLVSSRCCHLASLRVRFSIRAPSINHTVHHLFSNHHSSSFIDSISIPKHCKGASTSRQWFGKFFLVVSLDWFFAQALLDTGHKAWALYCCPSCALHWWREPRWLSASLLVSSSKSLSGLSTVFLFLARPSIWSSTQTIESSRFSLSSWSFPILPVTCCHVLRKEDKHKESKNWERERTYGDDAQHSLAAVPRAVCVSHKSLNHKKHTIATKLCLQIISQGILFGWFSSINSDLRSCSKNTPRKDSQIYVTTPTIGFTLFSWWRVLCLLPSDLRDKAYGEKKSIN